MVLEFLCDRLLGSGVDDSSNSLSCQRGKVTNVCCMQCCGAAIIFGWSLDKKEGETELIYGSDVVDRVICLLKWDFVGVMCRVIHSLSGQKMCVLAVQGLHVKSASMRSKLSLLYWD